jgi:hypothetical protein
VTQSKQVEEEVKEVPRKRQKVAEGKAAFRKVEEEEKKGS